MESEYAALLLRLIVYSVWQTSFVPVNVSSHYLIILCFNSWILLYCLVNESPAKKILQCGNLTGSARRVRDLAADLYNFIQEWNTQHLLGVQMLNAIMCMKLSVL